MASGFSHQSTRTKAISSFHTVKGNEQLSVLFHYYLDLIITLTSLLHPVLLPTSFLKLLFSRNLRMKYILSWVSITLCFCFVLALFGLICFSPFWQEDKYNTDIYKADIYGSLTMGLVFFQFLNMSNCLFILLHLVQKANFCSLYFYYTHYYCPYYSDEEIQAKRGPRSHCI